MTASVAQRAVGIFPDRPITASALQALQDAGFPRRQVMVVAKDAQRQNAIAGVPVQNHITHRASQAAVGGALTLGLLGGAAGLAVGLGLLTIPGLSPLLGLAPGLFIGESAGAMTALGGAIAGAATGGLVGALIGLGIPVNRARQYRDRVERGAYLVLLNGTTLEVERAVEILRQQGVQNLGIYDDQFYALHPNLQNPALQPPVSPATVQLAMERSLEEPFSVYPVATGLNTDLNDEISQPQSIPSNMANVHAANADTALQLDPSSPLTLDSPSAQTPLALDSPAQSLDIYPGIHQSPDIHLDAPLPPSAAPLRSPPAMPPKLSTRDASARAPYPEKRLIGTFATAQLMEQALNALKNARFPMHKISVIVRDTEATTTGDLASATDPHSASGNAFSGITGLMVGLHRLSLPGQGLFVVIGADAPLLTRGQTANRSADLPRSLMSLGISDIDTRLYSDRLSSGATLIMIRGVGGETLHATSILSQYGLQDWSIYDVRDATSLRGLN